MGRVKTGRVGSFATPYIHYNMQLNLVPRNYMFQV